MTENYGDWHEREMIEYADQDRERDIEWAEWEEDQRLDLLLRDEPEKSQRKKMA